MLHNSSDLNHNHICFSLFVAGLDPYQPPIVEGPQALRQSMKWVSVAEFPLVFCKIKAIFLQFQWSIIAICRCFFWRGFSFWGAILITHRLKRSRNSHKISFNVHTRGISSLAVSECARYFLYCAPLKGTSLCSVPKCPKEKMSCVKKCEHQWSLNRPQCIVSRKTTWRKGE